MGDELIMVGVFQKNLMERGDESSNVSKIND